MGQPPVLGTAIPDVQSTSLLVTLCSCFRSFLHRHTIGNTQLSFLTPLQRIDSLWMWRQDKRLQTLEVLQLHTITDWPSSSTEWGWNGVTEAGPTPGRYTLKLSVVLFSDICQHYSLKWTNSLLTNLKCNRLLLQRCFWEVPKTAERRSGMVGRKCSFTE